MPSQINLEGLGNKVGLHSRFNIEEIISRKIEKMQKPIAVIDSEIQIANNRIEAYKEFKILIEDLLYALQPLRTISTANNQSNIFGNRVVYANSSNGVPYTSYINIDAQNDAEIMKFDISVTSVAKPLIQQSIAFSNKTDSVVSQLPETDQFLEGTFMLNNIPITLESGDNINDICQKFNQKINDTKVKALIIQPFIGEYRIFLQSQIPGTTGIFTFTDTSNVLNGIFNYDASSNPNYILQQATNASIQYNNIQTIERSTNRIDDFIDKISFDLYQNTPNDVIISIEISPNYRDIADCINNFAEKYNQVIKFIINNQQKDDNSNYLSTARIRNHTELMPFTSILSEALNYSIADSMSYHNIFDIGLEIYSKPENLQTQESQYNGLIRLNYNKFFTAAVKDLSSLRKIFEFSFREDTGRILLTQQRGYKIPSSITDYTFNINLSSSEQVTVSYNDQNQQNNVTMLYQALDEYAIIAGLPNTIFEGCSFLYFGEDNQSIDVQIQQGVAEILYTKLDSLQNKNKLLDSLQDRTITLNDTYKKNKKIKEEEIERTKAEMQNRFSITESYIAQANLQLALLDAIGNSSDN